MRINLFGYTLIVELQKSMATRVESLAKTYLAYQEGAKKIARIRAYNRLTNATLKESLDWVESHFA